MILLEIPGQNMTLEQEEIIIFGELGDLELMGIFTKPEELTVTIIIQFIN